MKLPYYSMWAADFEMDERVLTMSWAARGLYNCLLNRAWINDGLPAEPEMVRRLAGADREDFNEMWPQVEACFPAGEDGKRRNPRQEKERMQAQVRHVERSESGKKGNAKRWHSDSLSDRSAIARAYDYDYDSDFVFESGKEGRGEKNQTEVDKVRIPQVYESVTAHMRELESVYIQAGAPIPEKHKQIATQLILSIPPERRARVANYCKWALVSGKWPSPAKTKALVNVLRDGDWDVELAPRTLPMAREPSARQTERDEAERRFMEKHENKEIS